MSEDSSVTLSFPATTERVRLARVLTATLADEAGFDYDEVEDVRIAVDELCFALLDAGPTVGMFDVNALAVDGDLRVTGVCRYSSQPQPSTDETNAELTAQILGTVVDDYTVAFDSDTGRFSLRKSRS